MSSTHTGVKLVCLCMTSPFGSLAQNQTGEGERGKRGRGGRGYHFSKRAFKDNRQQGVRWLAANAWVILYADNESGHKFEAWGDNNNGTLSFHQHILSSQLSLLLPDTQTAVQYHSF